MTDAEQLRHYALGWCAWLRDAGVHDFVADDLHDYTRPPTPTPSIVELPPPPTVQNDGVQLARTIAQAAATLDALHDAIRAFDGCALKRTAARAVIATGNPNARIMVIGEAPDAEEEQQGLPFCGANGALLGAMLASIGVNREQDVFAITSIFWRTPGNRAITPLERDVCAPFVQRFIALQQPKLLLLLGGNAAQSLLGTSHGMMRLRGTVHHYACAGSGRTIPALITAHPSFLMRQPTQKRHSWQDMLALKELLGRSV